MRLLRAVLVGVLISAVIAAVVAGVYSIVDPDPPTPTLERMANAVGSDVMLHLHRGHVPGRSGEIMLVPKPHRYLTGRWDLRTLGSDNPETFMSHPNPWAYLARVPLIFYGPGLVSEGREISSSVNLSDVAPTYARLVGLDDFDSDGSSLSDIAPTSAEPPLVIATIVLDGGGWNVLRYYPDAWPNIRRLSESGTTYTNATVGSAPSLTGPIHTNLGTGRYPTAHGIASNPWLTLADPSTIRVPTMSELWDESTGNRAVVAMMGYVDPHVGMIGRGAQRNGGDRDVAVFWNKDLVSWETNENYYRLPGYLVPTDVDALQAYERKLDISDGAADERWRGDDLDKVREGTPAFVRLTGDAVVDMISNEPFGQDDVTDFLWIEMKMPDTAGHLWNMVAPQSEEVLRAVDREVARFKQALDEKVGAGSYIFAITADHGSEPLAEATGGWRINLKELEADIEAEFGPVVELVTTLDIQLDVEEVERYEVRIGELVDFVAAYTLGDNIPDGAPGADAVAEERLDERLFAGVFPSHFLAELTPAEIDSFGNSTYSEGELTEP